MGKHKLIKDYKTEKLNITGIRKLLIYCYADLITGEKKERRGELYSYKALDLIQSFIRETIFRLMSER